MHTRTSALSILLLLVPGAAAAADVADERVVLGLSSASCSGGPGYELRLMNQRPDGTSSPATSWSVPLGTILEITDIQFEAPYNLDVWPHYLELWVVNRYGGGQYSAWRTQYGAASLATANSTTLAMTPNFWYQLDVRKTYHTSFGSGILINASAKPCIVTGMYNNTFDFGQVRVRGRLHPDDEFLFPPFLMQ